MHVRMEAHDLALAKDLVLRDLDIFNNFTNLLSNWCSSPSPPPLFPPLFYRDRFLTLCAFGFYGVVSNHNNFPVWSLGAEAGKV